MFKSRFNRERRATLRDAMRRRGRREKGLFGRFLTNLSDEQADAVLAAKEERLRKRHPNKGDGEILQMLLDWISGGGLMEIAKFIAAIIPLFVT